MNASPSCMDCHERLPIVFGRTSQHVECPHCGAAFAICFSSPERFQIARAERIPKGPLFHVRFIQDGVEQEQIFAGIPDGKGNFNINVPTPCTLLSVKQLVELESGARMFVVWQGRDCDQTPLYWLSPDRDDTAKQREHFANYGWHGGYAEYSLNVITPPAFVPSSDEAV